jgi:hypothetical protein
MSLHPTYNLHPTSYNILHYRSIIKRHEAPHSTDSNLRKLQTGELPRYNSYDNGTRAHDSEGRHL